jgi:hypothetical protein
LFSTAFFAALSRSPKDSEGVLDGVTLPVCPYAEAGG